MSEEEIQAFRAEALEAARKLFAEDGPEGLSMRRLASELGCSPMRAYRYFDGQQELIAELRAAAFERFAARQASAVVGVDDPRERLQVIARVYVDHALEHPSEYGLMFSLEPPERQVPALNEAVHRAFSYLKQTVETLSARDPSFGIDAGTAAHLFWAQLHGLVSLHLAQKLSFGQGIHELNAALCDLVAHWSPPRRA